MRTLKTTLFGTMIASLVIFSACKKDDEKMPDAIVQNDQSGSTETDKALEDVNDLINNKIGGGSNQRTAAYNLPCGVVSVDSNSTNVGGKKIYKLNYGSQTPCGYKYKSGQVSFQLVNASAFNTAGAIYLVTFTNYAVEVRATGSTITLNGTLAVTNTTGYYIWEAVTASRTITHKIRGTLTTTFANGQNRIRAYFQTRTWSSANGWQGLSLTINGDTTINSQVVADTGTTYDGNHNFKTVMNTAYKWENCNSTTTTADDWMGPYVLKNGDATLAVTIAGISPTNIRVEAGYYWNYSVPGSTPTLMNDCMSNAYKITTTIGTSVTTSYQLY